MTALMVDIMGRIFKAGALSLLVCLFAYPYFIRYLKFKSFGQQIRAEGPENHYAKKDTPTMGGLLLVITGLICAGLFLGKHMTLDYYVFLLITLGTMLLGFTDDYSKIAKKKSLGLKAREKLFIQILMGFGLAIYVIKFSSVPIQTRIPLVGNIDSWLFFIFFTIIVVTGTSNAVNLTDGLDGLASGTCAVSFLAYAVICYKNGQFDLAIGSFALCCACVGFLWFNAYPAKIFMGDTGSLALGAALSTLAIFTRTEFLLIIIGGIFVADTLSVILQVSYFKMTGGKRIFKMSPLHHHFEKCGWHEVEVTVRFWIISLICAVVGLLIYFKDFLRPESFK